MAVTYCIWLSIGLSQRLPVYFHCFNYVFDFLIVDKYSANDDKTKFCGKIENTAIYGTGM
jgi:uncharacterized membrane protein